MLEALRGKGVERASITLHVGYGTFQPIRVDRVEEHQMEAEQYEVGDAAPHALSKARQEGRRIIAVGTTTTRTLESLTVGADGTVSPGQGETALFIHPGHEFSWSPGLITNFHLPQSSLLMLVSAFAGREQMLAAYREAVANRYRFYSYGDAMFVHGDTYETAIRRIRPLRHQDLSAALAAEQGQPRAVCDAATRPGRASTGS